VNSNSRTEVESALDAGMLLSAPQVPAGNAIPYVVIPATAGVESLESLLPSPVRVRRAVTLHDPQSFIEYVNAYREPGAIIAFDEDARTFRAILDYHETVGTISRDDSETSREAPAPLAEIKPRWCEHQASFTVRETAEWKAWKGANGRQMTQQDFARFIENHITDIGGVGGDVLQGVALNLEIKKGVSFNSSQTLENGSVRFLYSEDVSGAAQGGTLTIPATFDLFIQPFLGGGIRSVQCRFRYKLQERSLVLWYEIVQLEEVIENALFAVREAIEEGAGTRVLAGEL
jgi:uncharacterized protein YfdQ (DUF2303 family)